MTSITIAVNEIGRRIGDSHHNAVLTDHEVDLLLQLKAQGWGYRKLAAKFEISKTTVRNIVKGKYRSQVAKMWRQVRVR